MNHTFQGILLASVLLISACGGARLSHDEIRKQIADIGTSTLVPEAVQVRRVVSQGGNTAIAETTVELAFQFERDFAGSPWHITQVRLGDRNWVSVPELLRALEQNRRNETAAALRKLDTGVAAYRQKNGSAPAAGNIASLADALHPQYMSDLVLNDSWGRPIEIEAPAAGIRFRSLGPDGQRGTADDVVFPE
jgi:hypothetical protein